MIDENTAIPRKTLTMASIRSYQVFVQIARLGLILAFCGFFVALVGMPSFFRPTSSERTLLNAQSPPQLSNRIKKITYQSIHKNNPYSLTAKEAKAYGETHLDLRDVSGTLQHPVNPIKVQSDHGHYSQDDGTVILQKNVHLSTKNGYELKTPQAKVDLNNRQLSGDQGVSGAGPLGTLKGQAFNVTEQGHIRLQGKPSLTIHLG